MNRITELVRRNWENILSNLVSNVVWLILIFIFSALISFFATDKWDILLLIPRFGILWAFGIYVVLAISLLTIFSGVGHTFFHNQRRRNFARGPTDGLKGGKHSKTGPVKSTVPQKVFISYRRGFDPDESLAIQICERMEKFHQVFIDRQLPVGAKWAKRIEEELEQSDFLICLLSEEAVQSEMVIAEIETAHRLAKESPLHKPKILPIRVKNKQPFVYPLSAYLNSLNWAVWESKEDTKLVIENLLTAISGEELFVRTTKKLSEANTDKSVAKIPSPFAQPLDLESPEGSLDPNSVYYIWRQTDQLAIKAINRNGVTVTIKGPRQMGKSSLLNQIKYEAGKLGKRVVFLDFQLFDRPVLEHADEFYKQFCRWISYELRIDDRTDDYWRESVGNALRCTRFVENHIFNSFNDSFVLAMDEVDRIFDSTFRSDFFSMLRSWHNSRASNPVWKRLDLALVTSTEPYQFVNDLNQSPFNVGEVLELKDFTVAQTEELNDKYGKPLSDTEIQCLMDLLAGHPYLSRRSFFLLASHRITFDELVSTSSNDYGPFGDHLRFHYYRMRKNPKQVRAFFEIIQNNRCADLDMYFRLHGAGLVVRNGNSFYPRNKLYATYFGKMTYEG